MFHKGIPLSQWNREKNNVKISSDLKKELYEKTLEEFNNLFDKFNILENTSPSEQKEYFDVFSSLILQKNMTTQDAIILSTCVFNGIDYFFTTDTNLIKLNNEIKKEYDFELLKPDNFPKSLKVV